MNPFRSLHDYEEFIYTLAQHFASVASSTLVVARRGATIASVNGEVVFHSGYRLAVRERLVFEEARSGWYAIATKFGVVSNNSTGTILSLIQMSRNWPPPIPTTSTFRPISSIIASLRRDSPLPSRISRS